MSHFTDLCNKVKINWEYTRHIKKRNKKIINSLPQTLILETMNYFESNYLSLKYKRFVTRGCKKI